MIGSIIQNIRSWFSGTWNGQTKKVNDNAPIAALAGDLKGSAEAPNVRADEARNFGLPPQREGERRRNGRRRGPGKARPSAAHDAASRQSPIDLVQENTWSVTDFQVPPSEGKMRFHDLDLPHELVHGIHDLGFQYCTPVQAAILPKALTGADAAARAQTGTGKTAVFLIDILTYMSRNPLQGKRRSGTPRALILAPTRELALQIEKDGNDLAKYTPHRIVAVFGGMDFEKQKRLLANGPVDIVAATPGRLLDFKRQGNIHLDKVEILIIDEADRMLDMGFIPDVQQIIRATPQKTKRQTMLFSATLTPEVTRFASQWTCDPVFVDIEPEQVAVDTVEQLVYITTIEEKFPLLYNLITRQNLDRVIVFGNRRDQTRHLTERFMHYGINSALLSGEVDQKKRVKTLEDFRAGKIRVLIATDVAARGLHVEGVSHVVNYNLPMDPEDYVHRIGRTGRAGASGISISFASEDDSFQIPGIEKFLGRELPCVHPEEELLELPPPPKGNRPQIAKQASSRTPRGGSISAPGSGRGGYRRPRARQGSRKDS